jgi:hypothetical protein
MIPNSDQSLPIINNNTNNVSNNSVIDFESLPCWNEIELENCRNQQTSNTSNDNENNSTKSSLRSSEQDDWANELNNEIDFEVGPFQAFDVADSLNKRVKLWRVCAIIFCS